ncbi:MAG: hypothetical protein FWG20_06450, partial [Candidatus Cloacimonetes bacterium]|nr:hypothetical protein [Candidatus Cloacimonadota bacterium]
MKKYIFFALFLCALTTNIFSVGAFNLFNGRNRNDLSWQEISTEHCKIIYSDNLENIALEAAAIADSTIVNLKSTFDTNPKKKVLIYISDQDNIPNGATVMDWYIFIWVNQNDYVKMFTGDDKWLRKVIAHELVHWFIAEAISDWSSKILPISAIEFPRDINEGFAQYFSGEEWGLNRGDRYLRTYSFDSESDSFDYGWWGGHLYASGFAFTKYLSEFYGGDENLVRLVNTKKNGPTTISIGTDGVNVGFYDFKKTFKKVYDREFNDVFDEWQRYIRVWYFGDAYTQKINHTDTMSKDLSINAITNLSLKIDRLNDIVIKDSLMIASVRLWENQRYSTLISGYFSPDSLVKDKLHIKDRKIIENASSYKEFDISPNGLYVVFSRYARHNKGRLAPTVVFYDTNTKKKVYLGEGSYPVVDNEGTVYYQLLTLTENNIFKRDISGEKEVFYALNPENQIGELKLNNAGNYLAFSMFSEDREFLVVIYDTVKETEVYALRFSAMPQELLWIGDDRLSIMVENSNSFKAEICVFSIEEGDFIYYDTPPYNVFPRQFTESDSLTTIIGMSETNRGRMLLGKMNIIEKTDFYGSLEEQEKNYYNRWIYKEYEKPIPAEIYAYNDLSPKKYSGLQNIRWRQGLALPWNSW